MRLRSSIAVLTFALAASHLTAAVSLIGQVGHLFRSDSTTSVPAGSVVLLVADTDKTTAPGLVNPLGTTLSVGRTLGGASGDRIVGVYKTSDLGGGLIGVDFGGTTFTYDSTFTAGTDLWLVWFPGLSATGGQVGSAEPFGAYRSDTLDTASQSTIAWVAPPDGSTSTLNAYTSSLGFGLATDSQLSATSVTSAPVATAGIYFGTFPSGGNWALYVRADGTATYLAYLPSRHSAIVVNLTVGLNGSFSAAGTEAASAATVGSLALAGPESPVRRAAAASAFTLTGQIAANGAVTGQLAGLNETFSGTLDSAASTAPAGLYRTAALNAASGATIAIVGPSGQTVVVTTGTVNDGAAGTVNASGQFTATTANGATLALTINASAKTVSATLTPAGGPPVSYAGLPEGVVSTSRVVNLSVRSAAGTGSQTLIVGFVVQGAGSKNLLLRGVGPAIKHLLPTALTDPAMRLLDGAGASLEVNDNWSNNLESIITTLGATPFAPGSKDAGILRATTAGPYTFHVYASDNGTGVALAELYDADAAATSAQVVNISARTQVGTGSDILIAGFVITGNAPKTLLIRGVGPTLTPLGVSGALADPQLYLYEGNTAIATNENWAGTAALKTAFATVGAGALVSDTSKDAALLVTLNPGTYTAQVSGVASTTGVALVEIFLLP
ncbi:MAG: hypothetical protein JSS11_11075 [Verrucomicrobia bacterium]|nr:hypothetical protein [Verrucomicrobiota bacterium]